MPEIVGFFALPTVALPGAAVQVTVQAHDADGDALFYRWQASGGSVEGEGTTVTWHAPAMPVDSLYRVGVKVTDHKDGSAEAWITIPIDTRPEAQACTVPCEHIIRVGPPRCDDCIGLPGIPALHNPSFVPADHPEAAYLSDSTMIIGLIGESEVRAYPVLILNRHEIVNDRFEGEPIAVTYCPFTASPVVVTRAEGAGAGLTFEVSGFLYNTNLILYDLQGQTLWSQMRFEAIRGRHLGARLRLRPAFFMSWQAWRMRFPQTQVLSERTGYNKNYAYDEYGSYNSSPYLWAPVHHRDDRLFTKDRVLGVLGPTTARAYPWKALGHAGVLNERLDGIDIVVVWYADAKYYAVFQARTSRGPDRFAWEPGSSSRGGLLRDAKTGTLWDLTGRALSGPLQGESLSPYLPAYSCFWFAWVAFWPDTELWAPQPSRSGR